VAENQFKIVGLRELGQKLAALGQAVEARNLRGAARDAMQPTEAAARATAPVGTAVHKTHKGRTVTPGFAQRSIKRVSTFSRARGVVRGMVGVAQEAFYAVAFVERGTSKMPAQPWLVPAFESTQAQVLVRFRKSLRDRLERIAKRRK
jgi:HK97 gp10 family phage protein